MLITNLPRKLYKKQELILTEEPSELTYLRKNKEVEMEVPEVASVVEEEASAVVEEASAVVEEAVEEEEVSMMKSKTVIKELLLLSKDQEKNCEESKSYLFNF